MANYLAVGLGCLIYLLLQLNAALAAADFSWKTFLRFNGVATILNLVIGCTLVTAKADLVNIYPITFVSSVILGVSGQALFKKISGIFDKKVDTAVGL